MTRDEMVSGPTEPESTLTKGEADLLAQLGKMDGWDEWLLFVNAGFKMEDAKGLHDRGLIEAELKMGMPAARLCRAGRMP